jgi:hypothetical protein
MNNIVERNTLHIVGTLIQQIQVIIIEKIKCT